jgi:protocatechuate 3,4-dioxygenase beta subunit
MKTGRRQFIHWLSATTGVMALGCGDDIGDHPVGPDADTRADTGPVCRPSTSDALGPFFEEGAPMRTKIADDAEPGERLLVEAVVLGPDCATPVVGALVEIWQADKDGVYYDAAADFRLRGQATTDTEGKFQVDTIRPGNYTLSDDSWRPAHLHFIISMAGLTTLTTQVYFAGDPYLPPNDGCTTCGSDDPARIISLGGNATTTWTGEVTLILANS